MLRAREDRIALGAFLFGGIGTEKNAPIGRARFCGGA